MVGDFIAVKKNKKNKNIKKKEQNENIKECC